MCPKLGHISRQNSMASVRLWALAFLKFFAFACNKPTLNAAVQLGEELSFDDILRYYNWSHRRTVLLGILGTKPRVLIRYFRKQGYKVVVTTKKRGMFLKPGWPRRSLNRSEESFFDDASRLDRYRPFLMGKVKTGTCLC